MVALKLMLASQAERLLLILMVAGHPMEVVLSQEKTPPRSTDQLHTMQDMLPNQLSLQASPTESLFRFLMLLDWLTHCQFTLTHTAQLPMEELMKT